MSREAAALEAALAPRLKSLGARRRGSTWYLVGPDATAVLNLQRSRWGEQYFINLGSYLHALGTLEHPKEHQCHVRTRLAALPGVDRAQLERALDLEAEGLTAVDRQQIIQDAMDRAGIPFLESARSVATLKKTHHRGTAAALFVDARVQEVL